MCKKFKFDHRNKWYIHNQESVLENETYKYLWDFDHLIPTRRPEQTQKKEKGNLPNCGFYRPGGAPSENKRKRKERQVFRPCYGTIKKTMELKSNGDTNFEWCTRNTPQRYDKWTGRLRNQRTSRDHSDYSIVKIGQNTEKSPGDLRKLIVT